MARVGCVSPATDRHRANLIPGEHPWRWRSRGDSQWGWRCVDVESVVAGGARYLNTPCGHIIVEPQIFTVQSILTGAAYGANGRSSPATLLGVQPRPAKGEGPYCCRRFARGAGRPELQRYGRAAVDPQQGHPRISGLAPTKDASVWPDVSPLRPQRMASSAAPGEGRHRREG